MIILYMSIVKVKLFVFSLGLENLTCYRVHHSNIQNNPDIVHAAFSKNKTKVVPTSLIKNEEFKLETSSNALPLRSLKE
jgi:hypothetical protein